MKTQAAAAQYRLIFRAHTPYFEEVWLEGYDDFEALEDDASNPYPAASREHQYWDDGWWAGFYGQARLFNLAGQVNPATVAASTQAKEEKCSKKRLKFSMIKRFAYVTFAAIFLNGLLHHYKLY